MREIVLKLSDWILDAFFGKTSLQTQQESIERYASARVVEAHRLCAKHGIEIPIGENFQHTAELLEEPTMQNYLHQLGFADAIHGILPQTSEPHYALGYEEGQQYE